jgi:hypothetical protein
MVPGVFFGETKMRLQILHYIAKLLRIQFKVAGIPYGSATKSEPGPGAIRHNSISTMPTREDIA